MPRIRNTILIRRSAQDVFDFVTTPLNWPQWHPASVAVSGTTAHSLRVGESVTEDFLVVGRRGRVVWTATTSQPPQHWSIEGDVEGGGAGTITYSLTSRAEGTVFVRDFLYRLPNAPYALLDWMFLRRRLRDESAQAVRRLRDLLERPCS